LAFSYFESHFLTFYQRATAGTVDSAEVMKPKPLSSLNHLTVPEINCDITFSYFNYICLKGDLNITGHVRASTYYDPIMCEPPSGVNRYC